MCHIFSLGAFNIYSCICFVFFVHFLYIFIYSEPCCIFIYVFLTLTVVIAYVFLFCLFPLCHAKKMANHVPRIQTLISEGKLMLLWFEQLIVSTAFSASGKFVYYQQQFKHHWDYGHCVLLYGGRAGFPVAMVTGIVLVVGWNWLFIPFIWDLTTTKQCRWSYARVLLLIVDSFCF